MSELCTPLDLVFGAPSEPEITGEMEDDYFQRLRERLQRVHDYTRKVQADVGIRRREPMT